MPDSEGTAQFDTTFSPSIVFAYDNTAGFQTGVALANLSATESKITALFRDESGALLGSAQLTMPALGHSSFFVNKSFTPTENRRGTIEFQSPSGDITGVGLRFSPSLSFTSVPSAR